MILLQSILRAILNFITRLFRKPNLTPIEPDPMDEPIDPTPEKPAPVKPNIIEDFITVGRANRPGYTMTPQYITIHDTGNANLGANARGHASYVKGDTAASLPVSWHFTVDDTVIYQHLPLNENGWHAGDGNGAGNRASIGIEICENADGDRAKAELNAVLLVAWLHSELSSLLPFPNSMKQHFDWSGKNCPHIIRARANGWQLFLDSVPVSEHAQAPGQ